MYEEEDTETLEELKSFSSKKKRSFSNIINSKNLSEDDMDELFLSY
jgi:hypothetical protein